MQEWTKGWGTGFESTVFNKVCMVYGVCHILILTFTLLQVVYNPEKISLPSEYKIYTQVHTIGDLILPAGI